MKLGGANGTPVAVPGGVVWPEGREVRFLADDSDTPRTLDAAELAKLIPTPERHLERRCGEGGCGPHGGNNDLVLVDRSGKHLIAKRQAEIEAAELVGEDVVWATFGAYGASGGVFRASAAGGQATKLWDGAVTELRVEGSDAYAAGASGVVWIDLHSGQTQLLAKTSSEPRGLTVRGDRLFWAEEGDPYWASKPSGSVRSAPRHGGTVVTHADGQPWPQKIAVDDDRIYWGARDKGGVWSVAITGGPVTTVAPPDDKCGGTMWISRTRLGVVILRGDSLSFRFGGDGEIWLIPIQPEATAEAKEAAP